MPQDYIDIRGAREHNLKDISLKIPRDKLVVITGLSGSGKSSLAFDTIYAEGQRRYVESLSAYARQFLGQMDKPDVDFIGGLSPAISIDQKAASHNPRSTVGTVTEIYDYLRLLYARVGKPHCPKCGKPIAQQTVQQMVDAVLGLPAGTRIMILGPVIRDRKGEHQGVFEDARKSGFVRVRVDGRIRDLGEEIKLDKNRKHSVEVVVDRLAVPDPQEEEIEASRSRLTDSMETALKLGAGSVIVQVVDGQEMLFSEHFACAQCGISLGEIAPRSFSFNSPHGACPVCTGLGTRMEIDPEMVIPNPDLSIAEGAIQPWSRGGPQEGYYYNLLGALSNHFGFNLKTPVRELSKEHVDLILWGTKGERLRVRHQHRDGRQHEYTTTFEGVVPNLERRYKETESEFMRGEIERYMTSKPCPACNGSRLKPEAMSVTIAG
ncbi:MAG TPA: excinuclease ABC subunit UvrA, partial [Chloroflexota bacterium]|nr:excinuclease ABC subunit UvrA [Chloroflexota bacterium]